MGSNSLKISFLCIKFNKLSSLWLGMSHRKQYKNYTLFVLLYNFQNVVFLAQAEHCYIILEIKLITFPVQDAMGYQLQLLQVSRFDGSFCRFNRERNYFTWLSFRNITVPYLQILNIQNEILFKKISALGLFVKYT